MATPTKSQHRYELIVYWSETDASFIVEVPELAGCMADGATYAEAVAAAELVIDEWIATARELGRPIPASRAWRAGALAAELRRWAVERIAG